MKQLFINTVVAMDEQAFEVVERKSVGHPDTVADGIAEAISIEYSRFCLDNFGAVLHHHLDKSLIMGGRAKIGFGIGEMERPFRLNINGRMSSRFGNTKIDYKMLQESVAKKYLKQIFPNFNTEKWLKINSYTTAYSRSPVWYRPRCLDDLPELDKPYVNDSSAIVGYWPLSVTERLVLKMEKFFYNSDNSPKFDYIGQDIKILAVRNKKNIELTLCVPFMSIKIPNKAFYFEKLKEIESQLTKLAHKFVGDAFGIKIFLNTQDRVLFEGPKKGTSHYFVVSGSALDYGEEGVVGRGNRSRGLISCARPFSTDAICGKNPAFHVGKVYAYFAEQISKRISEELGCECLVILVTQNKNPISEPQKVVVNITKRVDNKKIEKIVKEELVKRDWVEKIIKGKYFLPLPGGTYGYQES